MIRFYLSISVVSAFSAPTAGTCHMVVITGGEGGGSQLTLIRMFEVGSTESESLSICGQGNVE
jgi:hypothetical protein